MRRFLKCCGFILLAAAVFWGGLLLLLTPASEREREAARVAFEAAAPMPLARSVLGETALGDNELPVSLRARQGPFLALIRDADSMDDALGAAFESLYFVCDWAPFDGAEFLKSNPDLAEAKQLTDEFFRSKSSVVANIRGSVLAARGKASLAEDYAYWEAEPERLRKLLSLEALLRVHAHHEIHEEDDLSTAAFDLAAALSLDADAGISKYFPDLSYFDEFERHIGRGALTQEAAEELITTLGRCLRPQALRVFVHSSLGSELAFRDAWKEKPLSACVRDWGFGSGMRSYLWASPVCRPFFNADEALMVRYAMRCEEASALPYSEAKPVLEALMAEAGSLPPYRYHTKPHVGMWSRFAAAQASFEARLALTRIGFAIEAYHGAHGAYPESLEAVGDLLGGEIPIDPFTGEALRYEHDEVGFRLCSAQESGEVYWRGEESTGGAASEGFGD